MANQVFSTIHTNYGLRAMAQAEAAGTRINLTAVAVGDGAGNPVTPDETQTQLVREVAGTRVAPNRVYQDTANPLMFIAEMVIPAAMGGFVIREIGVFDDSGSLFAVANVPDTYKPALTDGAFSDTIIRMQFFVTNASVVSVQIDPNVAVATQQWIANTITIPMLLPGGTTGQVLAKRSNADGDTVWQDGTVAHVIVDTVDEQQTLADGQLVVTLAKCTTIGLALYIAGARLLPTQWTADATDITKLTLAAAYPAGTQAYFVQNDPAAYQPMPLLKSNNLADVPDKNAARTNLAVDSKVNTDTHAPSGLVAFFAGGTAPAGWLKCNGAEVSRTAYAALYARIGNAYGAGDGFNTFKVPDMRGEFIRGFDDGRGVDPGRTLGSYQQNALGSHNHTATSDTQGSHNHGGATSGVGDHQHVSPWGEADSNGPWGNYGNNLEGSHSTDFDNQWRLTSPAGAHDHTISSDAAHVHNIKVASTGGSETRPNNLAMLACIKF
jgi:phage-related tail fiber protein